MTLKHLSGKHLVGAVLACCVAAVAATPALALNADSYVSGSGLDANSCTLSSPCQSFNTAISKTSSGGTVHCLDSGNGQGITIAQSVTIDCTGTSAATSAILVNGSNINVYVIGLTVNGGAGSTSIVFSQGASLFVENCRLYNSGTGIGVPLGSNSGSAKLFVSNSEIIGNQGIGILITLNPFSTEDLTVTLKNVSIANNGTGILVQPNQPDNKVKVTLQDVRIVRNSGGGIKTSTTGGGPITVDIDHSVVSTNGGNGVNAVSNGSANNMCSATGPTASSALREAGLPIRGCNDASIHCGERGARTMTLH